MLTERKQPFRGGSRGGGFSRGGGGFSRGGPRGGGRGGYGGGFQSGPPDRVEGWRALIINRVFLSFIHYFNRIL